MSNAAEAVAGVLERNGLRILADLYVSSEEALKLSLDLPPCRIIAACDPMEINRGLMSEGVLGPLLHCKAIIRQVGEHGVHITLSAIGREIGSLSMFNVREELEALLAKEFSGTGNPGRPNSVRG